MDQGIKTDRADAGPVAMTYSATATAVSDGVTYTAPPMAIPGTCILCAQALRVADGRNEIVLVDSTDGATANEITFENRVGVPVQFNVTATPVTVSVEGAGARGSLRLG